MGVWPSATLECPNLLTPDYSFPQKQTLEGSSDVSSQVVPATLVEDLDWITLS